MTGSKSRYEQMEESIRQSEQEIEQMRRDLGIARTDKGEAGGRLNVLRNRSIPLKTNKEHLQETAGISEKRRRRTKIICREAMKKKRRN